jgi:Arm DNA-binding domain
MGVLNKLTAVGVEKQKEPGKYSDGGGLKLQVSDSKRGGGCKSWSLVYSFRGKEREMGLGTFPAVSLAEARRLRDKWRNVLRHGADPIATRDKEREAEAPATFGDCVREYLTIHESAWGAKTRQQWHMVLEVHAKSLRSPAGW